MAWKENTAKKCNALVEKLGGQLIKQTGAQEALVLMACGHERVFKLCNVEQTKKLRCKVCWAREKIKEHEQAIKQLEEVTN